MITINNKLLWYLEVREKRKCLPKRLWPLKEAYYVILIHGDFEEEGENGRIELTPKDFKVVFIQEKREKENRKRFEQSIYSGPYFFPEAVGTQDIRKNIDYFWSEVQRSIKNARKKGNHVEIGYGPSLNPDKIYYKLLKTYQRVYGSGLENLRTEKEIYDIPIPIVAIIYMLHTGKKIQLSYIPNSL